MSDRESFGRPTQFAYHKGVQCSAASPGTTGLSFFDIRAELDFTRFPNIRKQNTRLYELAIQAGKDFQNAKSFERTYGKVQTALTDVSLKLDESGKMVIEFTKPSTAEGLIAKAISDTLVDQMKGALDKGSDLFSSGKAQANFAKLNVILSHLSRLLEIRKDIDNKNLVEQQWSGRRQEATQKKVNFCLAAIAASRLGQRHTTQFTDVYIALWKKYQDYEKKLKAWYTFVTMEEKLAGTYQAVPEKKMRAGRQGY